MNLNQNIQNLKERAEIAAAYQMRAEAIRRMSTFSLRKGASKNNFLPSMDCGGGGEIEHLMRAFVGDINVAVRPIVKALAERFEAKAEAQLKGIGNEQA